MESTSLKFEDLSERMEVSLVIRRDYSSKVMGGQTCNNSQALILAVFCGLVDIVALEASRPVQETYRQGRSDAYIWYDQDFEEHEGTCYSKIRWLVR